MKSVVRENFGLLFEETLLKEIESAGTYKKVAAADTLIEIGQYVKFMPLFGVARAKESNLDDRKVANLGLIGFLIKFLFLNQCFLT